MMMMHGGMGYGLILMSLLSLFLLLGYALIIWILSTKENGWVKITGQIIAVVIAVLVIIACLYGATRPGMRGGMMGKGMMDKGMMNKGMMEKGMMEKGTMDKGMHGRMMEKGKK